MPTYRPPTIIALIAISVVIFLYESTFVSLTAEHAAVPVDVQKAFASLFDGDADAGTLRVFLRLITANFLHADLSHVLFNMVFLWAFGSLCSKHLGKWTTLALFLICGAVGNIAQCWLNPDSPAPIVGASGGIMAFEGVYLAIAVRWTLPNPDVWPLAYPIPPRQMAAFGVVGFGIDCYYLMSHAEDNIAFGAHIGGFVSGFLIAWVLTQRYPTADNYTKAGRLA